MDRTGSGESSGGQSGETTLEQRPLACSVPHRKTEPHAGDIHGAPPTRFPPTGTLVPSSRERNGDITPARKLETIERWRGAAQVEQEGPDPSTLLTVQLGLALDTLEGMDLTGSGESSGGWPSGEISGSITPTATTREIGNRPSTGLAPQCRC
jgi:hypothetical protein